MRQQIIGTVAVTILGLTLADPGLGAQQQELNPAAISITAVEDVEWVGDERAERAILYGDESQPGPYGFFIKWKAGGNFSQPHSHPTDRHIIVVSGTWWVGTGTTFDTDSTVPLGPGAFVVHHAGEVHYDGAKDEDAVMLIQGIGPATSTPAEAQ
jgi:redox-sensitive bicupin YhaK (pirin superfamily)